MSLPFRKRGAPEINELVVAQVTRVIDQGAYATLLEYEGVDAFIPWNEVSTKYIRNIRDVVKEGQIVIGKVIRIERKHGRVSVDVSIKRVFEGERRVKVLRWKRLQKAQKIVELAAKSLKKELGEAYAKAWTYLEKFADPLSVLEEAVVKGAEALTGIGIPREWAEALTAEAKKHVTVKKVSIRATVKLVSYKPDGVERIKKLLMGLKTLVTDPATGLDVYYVGAPRYRVEIEALDYKTAEQLLNKVTEYIEVKSKELGIDLYSVEREKA